MMDESGQNSAKDHQILEKLVISDPHQIRIVLHEQKMQILNILLHDMKNIQELKDLTGLNPGTVKRNLDELMESGLVFVAAVRKSDYNITMKYYQAITKNIEICYKMPI
jgi:predicted transcriptional regulator